jgi:hypothetical protein
MSEPTFNQNPYFTNEQLEVMSKDYRTILVDEEGRSYEPEYNSMVVRSDVLKLVSDVRQARRKQYEVEFERDRLRKELEKARKITFPRQPGGEGGWEIDCKFLDRVDDVMISNDTEYPADTETIEAVLLALETVLGQEGEGNQSATDRS